MLHVHFLVIIHFAWQWAPVGANKTFQVCKCGLKSQFLWRHLRRCHDMSPPNTHFWKWSNDIEKSESDLFWCKSMSNNVKSCKKINGRVQTFRFSVFTMGGHWLTGALSQKRGKQGKLKRELLKILNWYDLSRVGPCESWRPDDSKNVVLFDGWRF